MPVVTFSSPLHKDKTVYAVAGSHTKSLLALANENHVPIDKITQDQIEAMKVDDTVHTSWRLACQMVLRDEDIVVEYPSR